MEKQLFIETDAPYTLNFMLYVQNIFINQNQSTEQLKYPFFSSKVVFNEDFVSEYKDLWNQMIERLSNSQCNEMEIFYTLSFSLLKIFSMCSCAAFSSQEKATHIPKEIKKQINALAVLGIAFRSML